MSTIKYSLLIIFGLSQFTYANNPKSLFFKKTKSSLGKYKLSGSKKNDSRCSSGDFSLVAKDINEGIRLGHHIFLGPFSSEGDISDSKDYCKITTKFHFTEDSVTEVTETSACPKNAKIDEGVSTKTLKITQDELLYTIEETKFSCSYQKVKQVSVK